MGEFVSPPPPKKKETHMLTQAHTYDIHTGHRVSLQGFRIDDIICQCFPKLGT